MAHNIIIINGLFDDLIGTSPDAAGFLTDLKAKAVSVDGKLTRNEIPPLQRDAAHDSLHELQEWLDSTKTDTEAKQTSLSQWA